MVDKEFFNQKFQQLFDQNEEEVDQAPLSDQGVSTFANKIHNSVTQKADQEKQNFKEVLSSTELQVNITDVEDEELLQDQSRQADQEQQLTDRPGLSFADVMRAQFSSLKDTFHTVGGAISSSVSKSFSSIRGALGGGGGGFLNDILQTLPAIGLAGFGGFKLGKKLLDFFPSIEKFSKGIGEAFSPIINIARGDLSLGEGLQKLGSNILGGFSTIAKKILSPIFEPIKKQLNKWLINPLDKFFTEDVPGFFSKMKTKLKKVINKLVPGTDVFSVEEEGSSREEKDQKGTEPLRGVFGGRQTDSGFEKGPFGGILRQIPSDQSGKAEKSEGLDRKSREEVEQGPSMEQLQEAESNRGLVPQLFPSSDGESGSTPQSVVPDELKRMNKKMDELADIKDVLADIASNTEQQGSKGLETNVNITAVPSKEPSSDALAVLS